MMFHHDSIVISCPPSSCFLVVRSRLGHYFCFLLNLCVFDTVVVATATTNDDRSNDSNDGGKEVAKMVSSGDTYDDEDENEDGR